MGEIARIHGKKHEANRKNPSSMKLRTNLSKSTNPRVDRIMFFQRTVGNQAVQGLIRSGNLHAKKGREAGKEADAVRQIQGKQETTLQQKCKECEEVQQKEKEDEEEKVCKVGMIQNSLVLGSPGDIYEQEADRVSHEVSNSRIFSMGHIQQEFISRVDVPEFLGLLEIRGREISSKDKDGARRLLISAECGGSCPEDRAVSPSLESRILQSKGSGSALPLFIRKSMELQTGYDFSNVRVKTDSEAAGLNKSLGARAFTNGSDIWLGRNESVTDVKLMAHELTHVVQQGAAKRISPKSISVSGIRSKSKVLGYLQSLVKGSRHDSSVYHSDILQFQRENSPDKIMAMQQQILEKPSSSINNKENSGTLRGCLEGCTPSGGNVAKKCQVKSGPTYTPNGTIKATKSGTQKTASFNMSVEFENDTKNGTDASCCEVRQFIKWTKDSDIPNHPGFKPASNFNSNTWYEDRDGVGKRYGHRTGPYSECISVNHYEDSTGKYDCLNGHVFKGMDSPVDGSGAKTGEWHFELKVVDTCNGNKDIGGTDKVIVDWNV